MSQIPLAFTSARNRRHFLRIAAAATAAMTPFVSSRNVSAGNGNDDGTLPGCGPSNNRPKKCNCLLRGTEILTDHGSVPIENLRIGDLIQTESGDLKPVKWIGRNSLEKSSHAEWQESSLPICIAQSAIDTNVPSRDLFLTPWHSLFIDGFLIPVQYLINGTSIVHAVPIGLDVIEYFHIEFEQHEVMYADGVPVESLQVTDGREGFVNFGGVSLDRRQRPDSDRL
jgi:Hint domain